MINRLEIKNFKCFKEQLFEFAPLTIFCGANSAGKSTAIQAILSVVQNIDNIEKGIMNTYGRLFNFGKVADIFNHNADNSHFEITIDDISIEADITVKEKQNYMLQLVKKVNVVKAKFEHDFVYLCAERFGPRASYDVKRSCENLDIGIYGEYALSEYSRVEGLPCANPQFAKLICSHLIDSSKTKEQTFFTNVLVREAMKRSTLNLICRFLKPKI